MTSSAMGTDTGRIVQLSRWSCPAGLRSLYEWQTIGTERRFAPSPPIGRGSAKEPL